MKLLKKVVSESRKSSTLKKWLILLARLGLFAALILAFAQPFSAKETALQTKENVFYLDNSFSMQANSSNGTLLQNTVQDFLKSIPEHQTFTLFTNDDVFANVEIKDIQNSLLELSPSDNQLTLEQIQLRASTYFSREESTRKNMVLISDFQERMGLMDASATPNSAIHLIKPEMDEVLNVSIDSVYLEKISSETIEILAQISSNTSSDPIPVSLYDKDKLIAKTSAKFNDENQATVRFSIPSNQFINGRLVVSDNGLSYDNQFYFNIDTREKIKILSIGTADNTYLTRLYKSEEFAYSNTSLNQLNYGSIENQNLVILNELETIPTALSTALHSFVSDGGSLVVVPGESIDVNSYNNLASNYLNTRYSDKIDQKVSISDVVFNHPIFQNVFEKNASNFQYPNVSSYYNVSSNMPAALNLQNRVPFLIGRGSTHFFTASLKGDNSNFKNSPLIVPTFYNMAINSLKLPSLYESLGEATEIDIPITLTKDNILKVSKDDNEFIPQQRLLPKKVTLTFQENPTTDGIYQITNNSTFLRNISFNHGRKESDLAYLDIAQLKADSKNESVSSFFEENQKANMVNEFWKWFAILALLFVLIETLLQRFIK